MKSIWKDTQPQKRRCFKTLKVLHNFCNLNYIFHNLKEYITFENIFISLVDYMHIMNVFY